MIEIESTRISIFDFANIIGEIKTETPKKEEKEKEEKPEPPKEVKKSSPKSTTI